MGPELYGAKWRNFKLVLVDQKFLTDPPARLATPRLINLITDPQEREPVALPYLHTWTATHVNRLIAKFQASLQQEPVIPLGAPLGHVPTLPRLSRNRAPNHGSEVERALRYRRIRRLVAGAYPLTVDAHW